MNGAMTILSVACGIDQCEHCDEPACECTHHGRRPAPSELDDAYRYHYDPDWGSDRFDL